MAEILLTLSEIDRNLQELEQRTGISTDEFIRLGGRPDLSEDIVFEWGALLDHKRALEEEQAELHRTYLSGLHTVTDDDTPTPERQTALAA